ncbi:hypothetical protein [Shewanella phaeophyticola]|uniref:Lipoprotein n=1 Tax=Shewanella phaeophyticola TaxID=2978345 RepID=A0ABT2P0Y0_9GAMM|nr:hypothetical protein [Shewanella sp. KJ10-1]MCT8985564.1 hypothetical protein [Shewanella sp. KJ10-1]
MNKYTHLAMVSSIMLGLIIAGCDSSSSDDVTDTVEVTETVDTTDDDTATDNSYSYAIADSAQSICYDNNIELACPASSLEDFYGQDAQTLNGSEQSYTTNVTDDGDITVTDNVTGIIWTPKPRNER